MRHLGLLSLLILLLSCTRDEQGNTSLEFNASALPQKWELFRMTGGLSPKVQEGPDLEWRESYLLLENGTFLKSRETPEGSLTANGTFQFYAENGETGIIFTFNRDSGIIGNCTGTQVEYLVLEENRRTLRATWWACDGPGLFYKRTQ